MPKTNAESAQAQRTYWQGLTPEQRRDEVLRWLALQRQRARTTATALMVAAPIPVAASLLLWYFDYHMGGTAALGFPLGILMAAVLVAFIDPHRLPSDGELLSGDFTDPDPVHYFRAHGLTGRNFIGVWKRGGKVLLWVSVAVLFGLISFSSTAPLAGIASLTGLGLFLFLLGLRLRRAVSMPPG